MSLVNDFNETGFLELMDSLRMKFKKILDFDCVKDHWRWNDSQLLMRIADFNIRGEIMYSLMKYLTQLGLTFDANMGTLLV